jgi:hypothetical protein
LSPVLNKILPEEQKMLELKYTGKRFGQMVPSEILSSAKEVLLRIHVIAGWTMPPDELIAILVDEFSKKIVESYPNVTAEEIGYAFRSEGYKVKEWGKALNISLIDEVMIPYLEKRFELSRVEEHKAKQIEHKPDLAQIEKEYQDFLQTDLGKQLNPKI